MKKPMLVIVALIVSLVLQAKQIQNFEELMDVLKSGEEISMVAEYGKFILISDNEKKAGPECNRWNVI